jgi:hypothetical protein
VQFGNVKIPEVDAQPGDQGLALTNDFARWGPITDPSQLDDLDSLDAT